MYESLVIRYIFGLRYTTRMYLFSCMVRLCPLRDIKTKSPPMLCLIRSFFPCIVFHFTQVLGQSQVPGLSAADDSPRCDFPGGLLNRTQGEYTHSPTRLHAPFYEKRMGAKQAQVGCLGSKHEFLSSGTEKPSLSNLLVLLFWE